MVKGWENLRWWKAAGREVIYLLWMRTNIGKETIYPVKDNIFKALEDTPFDKVKVVLLGQDPYHTEGMAHGYAFSVLPHVKTLPPSLRRLLQEYQDDLGYPEPRNGDLRDWARRGVLLLNTILTVEKGKPLSHEGIGWEGLAFEIIQKLAERGGVVFLLMGKKAQEYRGACGSCPVVTTPHPSPLAQGFLGSKPFTRVNEALTSIGVDPVYWKLQ